MKRLSVGEFAAACGLSATALRRYGDLGVLSPAAVHERTGYRWYDPAQVRTGVLVRMLRELDVPLASIREVLATADPGAQLALVERHWTAVERSLEAGRAGRDHLARVLGGWEQLLAGYSVAIRPVHDVTVLLRRRRGDLRHLTELVRESVTMLSARAQREGFTVAGAPVSLYAWPVDARDDADDYEHDRIIEVCLPVTGTDPDGGAGDAVLPGGDLVSTDAAGTEAAYPAVLAGYGAVSQWAHEQRRRLLGPPLMIHLSTDRVRVGWRLAPGSPAGNGPVDVGGDDDRTVSR